MEEKKYPNSGRMYKNARKDKDTHPDGDGEGEIDCEKCGHNNRFFINGWRKPKDKNGDPWYSFAFKIKKPKANQDDAPQQSRKPMQQDLGYGSAGGKPATQNFSRDLDEEIPF